MTLPLLLMILLAALGWAAANVATRKMPGTGALGLMVWSSLFSPLPLAALSLAFEGKRAIGAAFAALGLLTACALAYLVIFSTLLAYGLWNDLIMRHGAGRIAPFSLMVPIFGVVSAALVLGERFKILDAAGAALVIAGLLVHVFGARFGRGAGVIPTAR
jgi:O-acetylserine/cysteine efflux transporter